MVNAISTKISKISSERIDFQKKKNFQSYFTKNEPNLFAKEDFEARRVINNILKFINNLTYGTKHMNESWTEISTFVPFLNDYDTSARVTDFAEMTQTIKYFLDRTNILEIIKLILTSSVNDTEKKIHNIGDYFCSRIDFKDETKCYFWKFLRHFLHCSLQPQKNFITCQNANHINKDLSCNVRSNNNLIVQNIKNTALHISFPTFMNKLELEQGNRRYWLIRAIYILYYYSIHFHNCDPTRYLPQTLPGWESITVLYLSIPHTSVLPIGQLLRNRKNECEFLMLFRGTINEWIINLQMDLIDFYSIDKKHLGKVHHGWFLLARNYFNYLKTEIFSQCKQPKINLSGHSLGAAISKVLSIFFKAYCADCVVSVESFAAPKCFDAKLTQWYQKNVQSNNWTEEFDPIPALPCRFNGVISECAKKQTSDKFYATSHYVKDANANVVSS